MENRITGLTLSTTTSQMTLLSNIPKVLFNLTSTRNSLLVGDIS